jgi:hypothetical protein
MEKNQQSPKTTETPLMHAKQRPSLIRGGFSDKTYTH